MVWCEDLKMPNSVDFNGRPFHFIGIGGIGMSALASVLARRGLPVSGSDLRLSHITQRLQDQGVHIFWSQDPSNLEFFQSSPAYEAVATTATSQVPTALLAASHLMQPSPAESLPQVICSTAIHAGNAEYMAAEALGCPIFHRSDVLAGLMACTKGIAVAGTHGKTTTSSLIGSMLLQAGLDPTIVIGGEVNAWQGNAHIGTGDYLVAEADESDGSLVKLTAEIGVVTNIELDHPDHYSSLDEVVATFLTFAQNCRTLVGCIDCPTVRDRLKPTITYSLDPTAGADYWADGITYDAAGTTARIWERGQILGELTVKLLGRHNLSNALAAIAVGRLLGVEFATLSQALATCEGARRRFERRGEHGGILFVDDYAHHPSEIAATLSAARLQVTDAPQCPWKRVVAIFQPHRYSRTQTFLTEFAQSFQDADVVVLTDIYSAGEPQPAHMTGETVATAFSAHHPAVHYQPTLPAVQHYLTAMLRPGDIALFLGAGNLNQMIPDIMAFYKNVEQSASQEMA